jgi:transcriptional regulator with GAF, ATPase, and Fis domain
VGNVRELRNAVERAIILSGEGTLRIERPHPRAKAGAVSLMLEDVERSHILRVLEHAGWRIRGREGAAEVLGLPPTTLEARTAKFGIRRPS